MTDKLKNNFFVFNNLDELKGFVTNISENPDNYPNITDVDCHRINISNIEEAKKITKLLIKTIDKNQNVTGISFPYIPTYEDNNNQDYNGMSIIFSSLQNRHNLENLQISATNPKENIKSSFLPILIDFINNNSLSNISINQKISFSLPDDNENLQRFFKSLYKKDNLNYKFTFFDTSKDEETSVTDSLFDMSFLSEIQFYPDSKLEVTGNRIFTISKPAIENPINIKDFTF